MAEAGFAAGAPDLPRNASAVPVAGGRGPSYGEGARPREPDGLLLLLRAWAVVTCPTVIYAALHIGFTHFSVCTLCKAVRNESKCDRDHKSLESLCPVALGEPWDGCQAVGRESPCTWAARARPRPRRLRVCKRAGRFENGTVK